MGFDLAYYTFIYEKKRFKQGLASASNYTRNLLEKNYMDKKTRLKVAPDLARVNVYFHDTDVITFSEEIKHTQFSLWSSLGGLLGLFLGRYPFQPF